MPGRHGSSKFWFAGSLVIAVGLLGAVSTHGAAAERVAYVHPDQTLDPYYPHRGFPKLTTPQWVGEEGVECVVTLGIDDMRDPARYELFLRPILDRLKAIDGRAPVSIMTCQVKADDPQARKMIEELIQTTESLNKLLTDVAEFNPRFDPDGRTARTAARLVYELAAFGQ